DYMQNKTVMQVFYKGQNGKKSPKKGGCQGTCCSLAFIMKKFYKQLLVILEMLTFTILFCASSLWLQYMP
ncbi:MAG: hypothetical protein J6M66_03365, partial [Lachnospiraceae bacterium]|nr:hypothetical protein [Lachnospiraceae bacterium]